MSMRKAAIGAFLELVGLLGSGPAFAQQPLSLPGCHLRMELCGQVLCHIFANQWTDMPDPRPLIDPTRPDAGPLKAHEWASICYKLHVGIILQADADKAANDPLAQIYAALEAATGDEAQSVFSVIFYNPSSQVQKGSVVYVGATDPLPIEQASDADLSARFVTENSSTILASLADGGQEMTPPVAVPPNGGMAMKVFTPRNIIEPKPGFYAAAVFRPDQQKKLLLDPSLLLLLNVFRRVHN